MIHHYGPVTQDGVVQQFSVPVSVPDPETDEVTGNTVELIEVIVYETQAQMLTAAVEYNGSTMEDLGDAGAVTQGVNGAGPIPEDADEPRAVVRMYLEQLTRSIFLHELVHATQRVYAWNFLALTQGNPWAGDNEDYAYMVQHTWELANPIIRWETSLAPGGPDSTWGHDA